MVFPLHYRVCYCWRFGQHFLLAGSRVVERQRISRRHRNRQLSRKVEISGSSIVHESVGGLNKAISQKKLLPSLGVYEKNITNCEVNEDFDESPAPINQLENSHQDHHHLDSSATSEYLNSNSKDAAGLPTKYLYSKSSHLVSQPKSELDSQPDRLVSLFQSNVSLNSKDSSSGLVLEHFNHVDKYRNMIDESKPLSGKLKLYIDNFGPSNPKESLSCVKIDCTTLLQEVVESKRVKPFDPTIPSITEVTRVFSRINSLNEKEWGDMIMALLERISIIQGKSVDDKPLILDIVGAWNAAGFGSKAISPQATSQLYRQFGLDYLIRKIIPKIGYIDLTKAPVAVFVTFDVLTKKYNEIYDQIDKVESLIKTLATVVSIPELDVRMLDLDNQSITIRSYILENWDSMREKARHITELLTKSDEKKLVPKTQEPDKYKYENKYHFILPFNHAQKGSYIYSRLRTAINLKNHAQVDDLWIELSSQFIHRSKEDLEHALQNWLTPEIFNHFITAYMSLQRPTTAIEVWTEMIEIGLNPNLKTWNILISGCKTVGDWRSSEKIWKTLSLSGFSPDLLNWSSRLGVLMDSNEINLGIQALDEMGRIWLEKARTNYPNLAKNDLLLLNDVKDAVKPDISCVNIAIAGLLKKNNKYRANKVLEWAHRFGIKPNTETYNIFLRPLIRKGNSQEAMALLRRMEEAGVEADVSTYTIILDNILRFPEEYSPEELKEKIFGVFYEMEQGNIQPNLYTYGKIIYQLVREFNPQNSSIIEAVLQHMTDQNVKPSIHIYTNLVEYFFLQNPPNLNLAQNILNQAIQTVGLDRVFWDRVVECYAQIGDTKSALNIIAQLSTQKTRVGWSAMRCVLDALISQKEWNLAKSLIYDVKTSASRHDFRSGTKGEALFWELAARNNISHI